MDFSAKSILVYALIFVAIIVFGSAILYALSEGIKIQKKRGGWTALWKALVNLPILDKVSMIIALNFIVFWITAVVFGGAPSQCPLELQAEYCLNSHGHYTVVSQTAYSIIGFQQSSVYLTFPFLFIFALIRIRRKKKSS